MIQSKPQSYEINGPPFFIKYFATNIFIATEDWQHHMEGEGLILDITYNIILYLYWKFIVVNYIWTHIIWCIFQARNLTIEIHGWCSSVCDWVIQERAYRKNLQGEFQEIETGWNVGIELTSFCNYFCFVSCSHINMDFKIKYVFKFFSTKMLVFGDLERLFNG